MKGRRGQNNLSLSSQHTRLHGLRQNSRTLIETLHFHGVGALPGPDCFFIVTYFPLCHIPARRTLSVSNRGLETRSPRKYSSKCIFILRQVFLCVHIFIYLIISTYSYALIIMFEKISNTKELFNKFYLKFYVYICNYNHLIINCL